jgi:hypothetical protein
LPPSRGKGFASARRLLAVDTDVVIKAKLDFKQLVESAVSLPNILESSCLNYGRNEIEAAYRTRSGAAAEGRELATGRQWRDDKAALLPSSSQSFSGPTPEQPE